MLTFLAGVLAFGTVWFWLFSLAVFVALTALVENDEGIWATIVFIGTIFSLNFLSKIPVLDFVKNNPGHTLMYVGLYFAIGIVWTIIKWYFFVHKRVVLYNEYKRVFLKANNADALTPKLAAQLQSKLESDYTMKGKGITGKAPDPADHKGDLTRWGTYWIFSMVGTALNDVVRRAWEWVFEALQTTYENMSKSIFKSAEADLALAKSYVPAKEDEDNPRSLKRGGSY